MLSRTGLVVLAALAGGYAQVPARGPGGPPPDVRLVGAVPGRPNRVVKNAPFSADVVTETTQTLADGNRIHQTTRARIYRDSEGRERNEQSLAGLRALAPGSNLPPVVYINDPVAGVDYSLNERARMATRYPRPRPGPAPRQPDAAGAPGARRGQAQNAAGANTAAAAGGRWGRGARGGRAGQNLKTDSLGRQTIEGVPADGVRTTVTIPAGSDLGNDQPLQIVSESWYSPDLQNVVLSKHTDPRSGETVVRLTNIARTEPASSLFQPPADYKITDGSASPNWNARTPQR